MQILFCTYSVTYTFLVFPFTQKTKNLLFFSFSVKIPIFASVPRAERSNAAKPAQLPNRYRLPNFLLFKSYLPTDYKKTIVFSQKTFHTSYLILFYVPVKSSAPSPPVYLNRWYHPNDSDRNAAPDLHLLITFFKSYIQFQHIHLFCSQQSQERFFDAFINNRSYLFFC